MDSRERDLSAVERDREEDDPCFLKRDRLEDGLWVSNSEVEEEVTRVPNKNEIEDGQSMWKRDVKEDKRNLLKIDEKEDEGNKLKKGEKEDGQNTLIRDEKDEGNALKRNEKEGESSVLERVEKEDELGASKRDVTEVKLIVLEGDEKADEENSFKNDEKRCKKDDRKMLEGDENKDEHNRLEKVDKEEEQTALEKDEKEDERNVLVSDGEEDEQRLLERYKKENKQDFSMRNEEDDHGTVKRDAEYDVPDIPKRNTEEEDTSTLDNYKAANEHSMLLRDEKECEKEEKRSVHTRDKTENEHSILRWKEKQDENKEDTSLPNGYQMENKNTLLKRDEKFDDPSFAAKNKQDQPKTRESNAKEGDERKEAGGHEDQSSSASGVFEEAVRVAGEAFQNMYFSGPILPESPMLRHRRTQSEIVSSGHRRTNSFQRLKMQMQKAWRGVSNLREDIRPSFNPEVLANQKRQWYQLHSSKALDQTKYKEPTSLLEHFIIVGLHPETNLKAVEDEFAKRKKWEMEMAKSKMIDYRMLPHRGPQPPTLEPQILFKYPPGKKMAMQPKDLATFCFPAGVKARLLERTPSLSDLNELVHGQEHLGRDDSSFIFSLKVADDATLYGVCLHVSEIVQRPPGILSTSSPLHPSGGGSRFLVSAPRCYCLLTRVPFFELHFELLNSMVAQERLKRITEFVSEMSLAASGCLPLVSRLNDQMNGNLESPVWDYLNDWMASAVPVDCAMALTAAAAGLISDEITSSPQKAPEPRSPDSVTASDTSDASNIKEMEKSGRKGFQCFDDNASETPENRSDAPERIYGSFESGQASLESGTLMDSSSRPIECMESAESVFSPARSLESYEVDDNTQLSNSETFGDDLIMEWARDHKNDLLQIVCGYHSKAIPPRGSEIVFQPLEHLQAIEYMRPAVSALGVTEESMDSFDACEVNSKLAAAEEALALSIWTTATVCRVLSLESILALLAGALLEKQVVVVCPNLGILSAVVLSLVPMIRPFQWQSLLLPVLPGRMFDFLDAPVPFLVGIQSKPDDLKIKTSNLIQVNVLSDQVKSCHVPSLPLRRELMAQLNPIHARLAHQGSVARRHPVFRCNEEQTEFATEFLTVMRQYMESLCSNLRSHTITSVQSNSDRVSLLLKDSFIDSFPCRDRPFIKLFVDTQLFSVLSDNRLSSFENGRL